MNRIETNRCDCESPNGKKIDDGFDSIVCENCSEVISYKPIVHIDITRSVRKVKKQSKPDKLLLDDLNDIVIDNVYNCDVFDLIPKIADGSIRLVHTDPPYGDDSGYGRNNKEILNNEDYLINIKFIDAIYCKMMDNSTMYLYSNHKFYEKIKEHAIEIGLKYKMLLIIVKNNIGMGNPFRNQYEVCLVFDKGNPEYYSKDFSNVVKMNQIKHTKDSHPHTKDDTLVRKVIQHSSEVGDFVFDGFMGSFATAISCLIEERRFLGSELDVKWFKKGIKSLESEKSKNKLYTKTPKNELLQTELF